MKYKVGNHAISYFKHSRAAMLVFATHVEPDDVVLWALQHEIRYFTTFKTKSNFLHIQNDLLNWQTSFVELMAQ